MKKIVALTLLILISLVSCHKIDKKYKGLSEGIYADIQTEVGDILLQLEYDKAPKTVGNFISLAEGTNTRVTDSLKGKPFYDGLKFHRVISKANGDTQNFMIQGGDPLNNGLGGPGYKFSDEFLRDSTGNLLLNHNKKGALSMANSGKATNGSQFFITLSPQPHLNGRYVVFGHVVNGQNVVDTLVKTNTRINTIKIVRIGKNARDFDAVAAFEKDFIEAEKLKEAYLSQIETYKQKATVLPSGLKIYFTKKSNEPKPKLGSDVMVNYEVHFVDGSLLDTNYKDVAKKYGTYDAQRDKIKGYEPFKSKYSMEARLVQGFKEGMLQMSFGDEAILFVPYHLAYGAQGGNGIPPKADLIFRLEIHPKK